MRKLPFAISILTLSACAEPPTDLKINSRIVQSGAERIDAEQGSFSVPERHIDLHGRQITLEFLAAGGLVLEASLRQEVKRPRALVITHVAVVDTNSGGIANDMTVTIQGDRILSVSKSRTATGGAEIIDGRGKFLIPGLWDMHVHLSYARSSALPVLIANGVTGVRDMGGDLAELDKWRTQIGDNTVVGPTILRAGPMLNDREFNPYQLAVADEAAAQTAVRTLRKVGVDFIKLHRRTSREAYLGIAAESKRLGLSFTGHVPMTLSPAEASDAGQTSIEHTETLFEGTFASEHQGKELASEIASWRATEADGLFAKFVKNGTFVDPTLIAQEHLVRLFERSTPDAREVYIAASARQEANRVLVPEARAAQLQRKPVLLEFRAVTELMDRMGVPLLAGSDLSYFHPPGFSLHDELALLVEAGLSPVKALRTATVHPAQLLRFTDVGVVAPQARADLVLLDANPLVDIRNTQRIRAVILRGKHLNRQALDRLLRDAARSAGSN